MTVITQPAETRPGHEYERFAPLFAEKALLDPEDPRRAELRAELVTGHAGLAEHIALRFTHRGVPHEDLTQVALVGLIHAVDRFDPGRGFDFLTFAVPTIMGEVRRYFRDTAWSMRVPRKLQERHLALSNAGNELSQRLGRAPTPSELAKHLNLPVDAVYEGIAAGQTYQSVSLDDAPTETDQTLSVADTALDGVDVVESLRPLIERLSERERRILALRYFRDDTQTQIAEHLGLSQMHVSRLLTRTLRKLREGLADPCA